MSANPLVVGPVDTATATSGTGLIDDIVGLSTAIRDGNWVDAALNGVATAIGWAATGVGIPYAITVVSERAAALSAKISAKVTGLVRSVKKLDGLLTKLDNALTDLRTALRQLGGGGGGHGAGGAGAPAPHGIGHPNGHQSGGSSRPRTGGYAAEDAWAARRYEEFRTGDRRIDEILDGLGDVKKPDGSAVTQDDINNVYDHLFLNEHPLSDYNGGTYQARFDFDPDIAEAWDRLRAGRPRQSDVLLLQHEIEEHRLMSTNPGMSYADAHHQTNTLFNWQASIAELSN